MTIETLKQGINIKKALDKNSDSRIKLEELYHKSKRKELTAQNIADLIDIANLGLQIEKEVLQNNLKKL